MEREDLTLCGGLIVEGNYYNVYCRENTGDLVYTDDAIGVTYLIGDIVVTEPIEIVEDVAAKFLKDNVGIAIGIAFLKKKSLVIINENTAEFRSILKIKESSGKPFTIDLNIEDI